MKAVSLDRRTAPRESSYGCDHFFGGIGQIVGRDDGQATLTQHLLPFLNFCSFEPHDEWDLKSYLFGCLDDGLGNGSATRDATENVDQRSL
jgi:hypothetical protein